MFYCVEYLEIQEKMEEEDQRDRGGGGGGGGGARVTSVVTPSSCSASSTASERERLDNVRLDALRRKEKHEQSAVASSEVKQRLQEFVLRKIQREASNAAINQQVTSNGQSPTSSNSSPCGSSVLQASFSANSSPNIQELLKAQLESRNGSCSASATPVSSNSSIDQRFENSSSCGGESGGVSMSDSGGGGFAMANTHSSSSSHHSHHNSHNQHSHHHSQQQGSRPRPLARTQSAPLPLGHPMLQSQMLTTATVPGTTSSATSNQGDPQSLENAKAQHQRNLLKQHIRQTVLQKSSSKQQLQSFEEETEAAIAQEQDMIIQNGGHVGPGGTVASGARLKIKRQYSCETMSSDPGASSGQQQQQLRHLPNGHNGDSASSSSSHHNQWIDLTGPKSSREATPDSLFGSMELLVKRGPGDPGHQEPFMNHRDIVSPQMVAAMASSSSLNPKSPIDHVVYQQMLLQQQHQLMMQQQQSQQQSPVMSSGLCSQQQPGQQVSITNASVQGGLPPGTVALIPENNQYPQILPHSRYPYYHATRPLSRALSSPVVALVTAATQEGAHSPPIACGPRLRFTTGLVYDSLMLKHQCICGDNYQHPEHGGRLRSIWARLQETGLAHRCERIKSRKASLDEIQACHSEAYTLLFGSSPLSRQKLDPAKLTELPIKSFVMLSCGGIGVDSDTTWNELHTSSASRMAAGCVTELSLKVAAGEIHNGFAIVRPPGHHAEHQQAMGFCYFNSVAIAVKQLRKRLDIENILIVDWDVHHGNGIQQIFYDDPHVLYISLHRHDDGNFFPGTGDPTEVGLEDGTGFTINIAWSGGLNPPIGDAEYLAAFRSIVMPVARDFEPEFVLVASGFDGAAGHPAPLGGYTISPACFGWMTTQLMSLAKGKVVLALEGGYDLPSICDCSQECVSALLGEEVSLMKDEELTRRPCPSGIDTLLRVLAIQAPHWPVVKRYAHLIDCSQREARQKELEECEAVSALASLTMQHINGASPASKLSAVEPMDQDILDK